MCSAGHIQKWHRLSDSRNVSFKELLRPLYSRGGATATPRGSRGSYWTEAGLDNNWVMTCFGKRLKDTMNLRFGRSERTLTRNKDMVQQM